MISILQGKQSADKSCGVRSPSLWARMLSSAYPVICKGIHAGKMV